MKAIERVSSKITALLFVILLFAAIVYKGGIWYMPNIFNQYLVSANLMHKPLSGSDPDYLYENYLEPLLFHLVGGEGLGAYLLFTLLTTLLFIALFGVWLYRYYADEEEKRLFIILVPTLFPVFSYSLYWVGMDGMTLMLLFLSTINYRNAFGIFFAVLLGMQHASQGVAAFALLLGSIAIGGRDFEELKSVGRILLAVVAGKILLAIWLHLNGIDIVMDRARIMRDYLDAHIGYWRESYVAILYSIFALAWPMILLYYRKLYPLIAASAVAFLFVMSVADESRVAALILFPSTIYWIFMNRSLLLGIPRLFILSLFVLNLLLPMLFVWEGQSYTSVLERDLPALVDLLEGRRVDLMSPFERGGKWHFEISLPR